MGKISLRVLLGHRANLCCFSSMAAASSTLMRMPPRSRASASLFPQDAARSAGSNDWIIAHCDGGSRGNPGPAGYGAVLQDSSGLLLAELSEFLGIRSNNVAEYSGLLAVLQWALDHDYRRLRVVSDSLLMVNQINGRYKVASPDLRPLWEEARRRIAKLEGFEISHALRHKNKDADRLANEAMDRGMGRNRGSGGTDTSRATPYPSRAAEPPEPASFGGVRENPGLASQTPPTDKPTAPATAGRMLRGLTRNGAIHLLGGASLPDGVFVKVIPE